MSRVVFKGWLFSFSLILTFSRLISSVKTSYFRLNLSTSSSSCTYERGRVNFWKTLIINSQVLHLIISVNAYMSNLFYLRRFSDITDIWTRSIGVYYAWFTHLWDFLNTVSLHGGVLFWHLECPLGENVGCTVTDTQAIDPQTLEGVTARII
jgi:hypothetical protein